MDSNDGTLNALLHTDFMTSKFTTQQCRKVVCRAAADRERDMSWRCDETDRRTASGEVGCLLQLKCSV